ncbi:uncharacterized protein N7459_009506 [Penicillium hispanicum]|uniref:uncharacterized protein n=1 Tax=Penicillium hispanicum TaxID=1080232 RepID=UPI00254032F8|nr:uncharacterized protein N7459_009506 [Penicillium hispanicum]KAJ5570076.1 hypothetical protein N7459_009506 [Penicillium hispanicum]
MLVYWLAFLVVFLQLTAGYPATNHSASDYDPDDWFQGNSLSKKTSRIPSSPQYLYEDKSGNLHAYDSNAYSSRLSKRADGDLERQKTNQPEMKFISQPKNSDLNNVLDFAYVNTAGRGVLVYVHDTGINIAHQEFTGTLPAGVTRGNIDWLLPQKDEAGNPFPQVNSDEKGHGTCVASKVVGVNYGVAKSVDLKMVPLYDEEKSNYILPGLQAIVDDMNDKDNKAEFFVVNLSYSLDDNDVKDDLDKYRSLYQNMIDKGALLVTTAGNDGQKPVDSYPAIFAKEDSFKDNLIVVGAVDVLGNPARFSQNGPLVDTWAPGTIDAKTGIECAAKQGVDTTREGKGTSYAAPQVAGLAAYLYSIDPSLRGSGAAGKIKARIKSLDYARVGNGPECIWNGEFGTDNCDVD